MKSPKKNIYSTQIERDILTTVDLPHFGIFFNIYSVGVMIHFHDHVIRQYNAPSSFQADVKSRRDAHEF